MRDSEINLARFVVFLLEILLDQFHKTGYPARGALRDNPVGLVHGNNRAVFAEDIYRQDFRHRTTIGRGNNSEILLRPSALADISGHRRERSILAIISQQAEDIVWGQLVASVQKGEFHGEGAANDFGSAFLHQFRTGIHCSAGGQQIIDQ